MDCDHPDLSEGDLTHPSEFDLANIMIVECRYCGTWFHVITDGYDEIMLAKIEENRKEAIESNLRPYYV